MISENQNRVEGVTYATADEIMDVMDLVEDRIGSAKGYGVEGITNVRIADDLNWEYQGWWGENRYKITIVVEKI